MLSWNQFRSARPDMARVGANLLYDNGSLGLGFVATVRPDGGPRVHPICPLLSDDGLFAFIVPGPKLADLRRDGQYALHCETFPPPNHDDAFYLTGRVAFPDDTALRATLTAQFLAERHLGEPWPGFDDQTLIEFRVAGCLLTLTEAREGFPAGHTVWHPD
jgi:hypothetical protein